MLALRILALALTVTAVAGMYEFQVFNNTECMGMPFDVIKAADGDSCVEHSNMTETSAMLQCSDGKMSLKMFMNSSKCHHTPMITPAVKSDGNCMAVSIESSNMTKAVKAMGCKSAASGLSAPSFLLGALAMTAVAMLH